MAKQRPPPKQSAVATAAASAAASHQQHVEVRTEELFAHFQSPYPPPEFLRQYNDVSDGLAERLVQLVDHQQEHRHAQERTKLDADIRLQAEQIKFAQLQAKGAIRSDLLSQAVAGTLGLTALGLAAFTAWIGAHWSVSIALVSLPVVGMVQAIRQLRDKPKDKPE